ncbi:recombinase family protein [Streptomyces sp. NPDC048392]|uniref:recombinase family protein n=1 Tax=Streptomyces sp. NPDC048392 TaxID=3365543 RepID=UPI00371E5CDB
MTQYIALYCRLSPRPDGSYEGVGEQETWGRSYAAAKWPGEPIEVFADSGISAANGDRRPEYERLRECIARGEVRHLWCVEQSRLERREVEWFTLAAELDAAGIKEVHTNRDGVVRPRDEVAGIRAVLNAGEVRKLKKRVNDTLRERAAQGRPPGSKPFGYEHGLTKTGEKTYAVVPREAEAIRWAAGRVLDGWALENIARGLREQGLHGPHRVKVKDANGEVITDEAGKPVTRPGVLTARSVRNMVTKPTIAGFRVHRGEIIGRGNWPAILDEGTWQACRAKLTGTRTVRTRSGFGYDVSAAHTGNSVGRKYTLTGGLAVCGVCEAPLIGAIKTMRNHKRKPYLLCHPNRSGPNGPGRGCIGILLEPTEDNVVDRLFKELDKPEFLERLGADDHERRRAEITSALTGLDEGDRAELAAQWGRGELKAAEWRAARQGLDERERRLRDELAMLPPPSMKVDISAARWAWPGMTLDEKREFLRMFIKSVVIVPAKLGKGRFDENRVQVEWR